MEAVQTVFHASFCIARMGYGQVMIVLFSASIMISVSRTRQERSEECK
jgi:hypothetical protein